MLSFNGARITRCSDNAIIYNKVIPQEVIRPIYEAVKEYPGLDLISYTDKVILSGIKSNEYTEKEAAINSMDICPVEDFPAALDFPVNKMLIPGERFHPGRPDAEAAETIPRAAQHLPF